MMQHKPILFLTLMLSMVCGFGCLSAKKTMNELTESMQGSFNSSSQAAIDTNYFDISLEMKRIWADKDLDGVYLYVEQAVTANKEKPYRQRVYHLEQVNKTQFTSTIYKIEPKEKFIGAHNDLSRFDGVLPTDLVELLGCAIDLIYDPKTKIFSGSTRGSSCKNAWGEATYATSEVIIQPGQMLSWDRGWNDDDEHVWGAENGGYIFIRY